MHQTLASASRLAKLIVNKVASYFSKSPKRQDALKQVQEELDYGILKVLKYQETRWLSRYGAVTALCTNLEPVLHVLQQGQPDLFEMLRSFKIIYLIHFLGDILEHLKKLSLEFQKSTIDITLVGGLARAAISDIRMDYLEQKVELNGNLTDSRGYPIIPDHGFFGGPLSTLRAAVKGKEYRGIEMVRDFDGLDLAEALNFQRSFSLAMVAALENRIEDSSNLSKQMKILVPRYLPERGRDLKKYGEDIAKEIAEQYGNEKINLDGVLFDPIIHKEEFLREYRKWKNQDITEWEGMNFMKCWGNILAAPQWAAKYPQLLQIALIGMVQCCSTAECERGFSQLNIMKIKFRNGLKTETINALLLICLAGPSLESYDFSRSIQLWKDDANYRHMFTSGIAGDMLSDNEEAAKGEDKEEEGENSDEN